MSNKVLEVKDLRTFFYTDDGIIKALDGVSYTVKEQETLGIIGESGCGKSVTAQSVMRIVPPPGRTVSGTVDFYDEDGTSRELIGMEASGKEIRSIRGKEIAMIFQEPMTSLSPIHTVGNQIEEALLLHKTEDKPEKWPYSGWTRLECPTRNNG